MRILTRQINHIDTILYIYILLKFVTLSHSCLSFCHSYRHLAYNQVFKELSSHINNKIPRKILKRISFHNEGLPSAPEWLHRLSIESPPEQSIATANLQFLRTIQGN